MQLIFQGASGQQMPPQCFLHTQSPGIVFDHSNGNVIVVNTTWDDLVIPKLKVNDVLCESAMNYSATMPRNKSLVRVGQ